MTGTRYIELTSAHRDRVRYPHPSQFIVELSFSGRNNTSASSRDPIFNSVMSYPPPMLENQTYSTFGYAYAPLVNGANLPSNRYVSILPIAVNKDNTLIPTPPYQSENGYIGDIIELITQTSGGLTTEIHEYRKIIDYTLTEREYLTTTIDAVEPILTTSLPLLSTLDCDLNDFFVGFKLEFTATTDPLLRGTTRTVEFYRAYDRRLFFREPIEATITAGDTLTLSVENYELQLDEPFSVDLPILTDNCAQDDHSTFRIRAGCDQPIVNGTLTGGTTTTFELPPSVGTTDFTGYTIWITTDPIVLSGALVSASFVALGGTQIQGTFVLPASASVFPDDFLKGMTITLTSGAFDTFEYIITDWVQATLTGTLTPGWTSLVAGTTAPSGGDTFAITQPHPSQYRYIKTYDPTTRIGQVVPFTYTNMEGTTIQYAVSSADTFEILQYLKDNYQPLDYPESSVAQQQAHCYEIELISLTLPNVPLKSGIGGRITFYPYVYVEFRAISQGTSIYDFNSNNPVVAHRIMFRAPMLYNYQPEAAAFITLDGHGMTQTLKFNPNDAFSFAVYLPNGDLFLTEEDFVSPSEPNPLLQITACFGLHRL